MAYEPSSSDGRRGESVPDVDPESPEPLGPSEESFGGIPISSRLFRPLMSSLLVSCGKPEEEEDGGESVELEECPEEMEEPPAAATAAAAATLLRREPGPRVPLVGRPPPRPRIDEFGLVALLAPLPPLYAMI